MSPGNLGNLGNLVPFNQGNMRNPMGGSWKPPPRRPKFEQAPRGNNLGFGNEVQVLVNTHSLFVQGDPSGWYMDWDDIDLGSSTIDR